MSQVRIGVVEYLNTAPLIEGLARWEQVRVTPAPPARLIDLLLSGEVDVALVSLIDAARAADRVTLLPAGMIGCEGPTLTVRVFSRVPLERVRTVDADAESHTSVALLEVLLHERFGVRPVVRPLEDAGRLRGGEFARHDADAVLLIGDKVMRAAADAELTTAFGHQTDLGEAWHELTGLPFVYACWACRSAEADLEPVADAAAVLDRQRRRNMMRLGSVIARRAPQRGWPLDAARAYLGGLLRYELGDREREAADRFLSLAVDLGLAPAMPRWHDEPFTPRS